jgi:hypothetical protein
MPLAYTNRASKHTIMVTLAAVVAPTQDDFLPPPPRRSELFARLNAGNVVHDTWVPTSSHTAKCDLCLLYNKSVVQRCFRCNLQLCRKCIPAADTDGIHSVRDHELTWVPTYPPPSRAYTRAALSGSGLNTTGRRSNSYSRGSTRSKVIKTSFVRNKSRHQAKPQGSAREIQDRVATLETFLGRPERSNQEHDFNNGDDSCSQLSTKRCTTRESFHKQTAHRDAIANKTTKADKGQGPKELRDSHQTAGSAKRESFLSPVQKPQQAAQYGHAEGGGSEQDKRMAWESNPILVDLRSKGLYLDAEMMLEQACDLLGMRGNVE